MTQPTTPAELAYDRLVDALADAGFGIVSGPDAVDPDAALRARTAPYADELSGGLGSAPA